jgi:2-polyprenyl-6-methoxyphenol hydroxylase-like FAD-dependent oxidoreductase
LVDIGVGGANFNHMVEKDRTEFPKRTPFKVIVIGAGTGGLCLAHGLKSVGISVQVYERAQSSFDRQPGHRISINPTGNRALNECLPAPLFEKLVQNSVRPSRGVSFLDERLRSLLTFDLPEPAPYSLDAHRPITRAALRCVLLEGLDDVVHFGKRFVGFEDMPDGRVRVRFEDGSNATGDVVVGADGASSTVRARLVPHAERVETGILAISGKLTLTTNVRAMTPTAVLRGPTLVLGPKGCFLFADAVQYKDTKPEASKAGDAVGLEHANPSLLDREEYVIWAFSARREKFGLAPDQETPPAADLKAAALVLMKDWNPTLRQMVQQTCDLRPFSVKTSVPIAPWKTKNVTLLGDSLHNMTPFRGIGANTALRDAAALKQALVKVARGEVNLLEALADYEREMIETGFAAVRLSLENMERLHSEGLKRTFAKFAFRLMNTFPSLKERFRSR